MSQWRKEREGEAIMGWRQMRESAGRMGEEAWIRVKRVRDVRRERSLERMRRELRGRWIRDRRWIELAAADEAK